MSLPVGPEMVRQSEAEWNLKRENLSLRIELFKSQAQLLQIAHDRAAAELQAMGDKWEPEP